MIGTLEGMNEVDQEIRRERLAQEIGKEESVAAFARKYQVDATYMRQLLSKHRPFGEKAAKKLEHAMGKPDGWLSAPEDAEPTVEIAGLMRLLTPEQRAQVIGFARGLAASASHISRKLPEVTSAQPLEQTKAHQAILENSAEIISESIAPRKQIMASHNRKALTANTIAEKKGARHK